MDNARKCIDLLPNSTVRYYEDRCHVKMVMGKLYFSVLVFCYFDEI